METGFQYILTHLCFIYHYSSFDHMVCVAKTFVIVLFHFSA